LQSTGQRITLQRKAGQGRAFRLFQMGRISLLSCLALVLLALAGIASAPATAQGNLRGKQSGVVLPQAASTPGAAGLSKPAAEPRELEGMLAAQNEARRRLNLAPLAWSAELSDAATKTATVAADASCSRTSAQKVGDSVSASVYWATALPRYSGGASTQAISPTFIVSEWQSGREDYNSQTGECRRGGECRSWARMVAPAARNVGCARVVCPSQAQIWACHYDAPKSAPDLRRRAAN
jgi:pathogenesis-related protein 1